MTKVPIISAELNQDILAFGKGVFGDIERSGPPALSKRFWASRLMRWAMSNPTFKLNLFRLVDVLPSLRSSKAVARHVEEYLADNTEVLGGMLALGLKAQTVMPHWFSAYLAKSGVREMASLFIAGRGPKEGLSTLRKLRQQGFAFTVDLLGEFCVSEGEAERYVQRYLEALSYLAQGLSHSKYAAPLIPGHPADLSPMNISIKLSALYSQCGALNFERSVSVLSARLSQTVRQAKALGARICIDAEDTATNAVIYEVFFQVFGAQEFRSFPYPGIVVQSYARDSRALLERLLCFAEQRGSPIAVRLVKGAYWDYESALSQQNNWSMPLFGHKYSSDAQFEKLSRILLENREHCLPAFASHNVRSLSHACCYAERLGLSPKDYELQMLYGMAEPIAAAFAARGYLVRLYAPLGETLVGMGYLVRRLLENTSNESFLRHTFVDAANQEDLLAEPLSGEI